MSDFKFPRCVAADGTVTFPDKLAYNPYLLPWVTGAGDTLPHSTRDKYPNGPKDLSEKLAHLKSKRAALAGESRSYAWNVGGTSPQIDDDFAGRKLIGRPGSIQGGASR